MRYARFLTFNVVGAIGWVTSMIMAGYLLGNIPVIRQNFEKVVLLIIVVSLIPAAMQVLSSKKSEKEKVNVG
jgi:membrane-associated protein